MADAVADYHVETQRLRVGVASLKHNLERHKFDKMQHESEARKAEDNIAADLEAIADHEDKLALMVETHGEAPPDDDMGEQDRTSETEE